MTGIEAYVADDLTIGVALREQTLVVGGSVGWLPVDQTPPADLPCHGLLADASRTTCSDPITVSWVEDWLAANPFDRALLLYSVSAYTGVTADVTVQALTGSVVEQAQAAPSPHGLGHFTMIRDEGSGRWVGVSPTALMPDNAPRPLWPFSLAPAVCPGCR